MNQTPAPGIYTHYKGGRYRVLFLARESTNARRGEPVVVYSSLNEGTEGNVYVRTVAEFTEYIIHEDELQQRFRRDDNQEG